MEFGAVRHRNGGSAASGVLVGVWGEGRKTRGGGLGEGPVEQACLLSGKRRVRGGVVVSLRLYMALGSVSVPRLRIRDRRPKAEARLRSGKPAALL